MEKKEKKGKKEKWKKRKEERRKDVEKGTAKREITSETSDRS